MDEILPEQVLTEIFSYLKFKDLCELSSKCTTFNNIISSNSTLVDNFRIIFDYRCNINVDFWIRKNYRRIKVVYVDKILIKFLECCGSNICDIKIECVQIEMRDLKKTLTLCPNLNQLDINTKYIHCSNEDLAGPVIKLTLVSLTVCTRDDDIFKIFQISAKNINVDTKYYNSRSEKFPFHMIKTQKHLKTLQLDEHGSKLFNDNSMTNVDFQLETLIVKNRFYCDLDHVNFMKFLKNQKSLRRFDEEKIHRDPYECRYVYSLREFENIKELNVLGPYIFLHPMPYIENFTIYISPNGDNFRDFHKTFPNLNNLSCIVMNYPQYSHQRIKFVENHSEPFSKYCFEIKLHENLKTLTFKNMKFRNESLFDDDVDIKIENLTIYRTDNINWLIECFKNDRIKLKSLTIDRTNMKKSQRDYLESLTRSDDKKIDKLKIYMPMKLNENRDYVCSYLSEDEDDDGAKRRKLE